MGLQFHQRDEKSLPEFFWILNPLLPRGKLQPVSAAQCADCTLLHSFTPIIYLEEHESGISRKPCIPLADCETQL